MHRASEIISFILFLMISLGALGIFALGHSEQVKNGAIHEFLFDAEIQH